MSLSKHSSGFFVADDCLLPFGLADSVAKKTLVSHINQPEENFHHYFISSLVPVDSGLEF